MKMLLEFNIKQ